MVELLLESVELLGLALLLGPFLVDGEAIEVVDERCIVVGIEAIELGEVAVACDRRASGICGERAGGARGRCRAGAVDLDAATCQQVVSYAGDQDWYIIPPLPPP